MYSADHRSQSYFTNLTEYSSTKKESEQINDYKANGHLLWSKAKWIKDGKKCTKYFIQLDNRNYKTKYIKVIHANDRIKK